VKKVRGIKKESYEVLIVDRVGSEWLEYCIPEGCSRFIVEKRGIIPFVKSLSFFYTFLLFFVKIREFKISWLSAIILELKPKVVMTFIDNNRFMGKLQTIFPDILVVSVQNGSRDGDSDPCFEVQHKEYLSFPHYFGFGDYEFDIMKNRNCSVEKYYPIGSLKLGIFLSNFYNKKMQRYNKKSICFVSQYVYSISKSLDLINVKLMKSLREMCKLLSDFSKDNNISVDIAMRHELDSESYQSELEFLKKFFDGDNIAFHANERENMASYQIGLDSDLIVAFHSTLLFELFGMGKKVLLCGRVDQDLVDMIGCRGLFKSMPNECLLDSWIPDEFSKQVRSLIEMDDENFSIKSKDARKYYMNFGGEYPHQIIHNAIQDKCK
jgi:surface carbohydrate biosynthesis protein